MFFFFSELCSGIQAWYNPPRPLLVSNYLGPSYGLRRWYERCFAAHQETSLTTHYIQSSCTGKTVFSRGTPFSHQCHSVPFLQFTFFTRADLLSEKPWTIPIAKALKSPMYTSKVFPSLYKKAHLNRLQSNVPSGPNLQFHSRALKTGNLQ